MPRAVYEITLTVSVNPYDLNVDPRIVGEQWPEVLRKAVEEAVDTALSDMEPDIDKVELVKIEDEDMFDDDWDDDFLEDEDDFDEDLDDYEDEDDDWDEWGEEEE